jgi:hypothetical protein
MSYRKVSEAGKVQGVDVGTIAGQQNKELLSFCIIPPCSLQSPLFPKSNQWFYNLKKAGCHIGFFLI